MNPRTSWTQALAVGLFLAVVGIILPFGHIYLLNTVNLTLPFSVHLQGLALLGLAVVVLATLLQVVVPPRVHSKVRAGLLALGIFLWAETTLFIGNFGFFTGDAIDWSAYRHLPILEAVLAILLVVLLVRGHRLLLRRAGLVMILLTLSAAANLANPLRTEMARTKQEVHHTFTREGLFDLSPEHNVILIILDTYQADVFADIVADDPSWKPEFDGFTYFPDATSSFPKTYASIPEILSGQAFDNTRPFPDYLRDSMLGDSFPRLLKEAGFDVRYHAITLLPYFAHPEVADNLTGLDSPDEIVWLRDREQGLMQDLLKFRLSPFVLKRQVHEEGGFSFGARPPANPDAEGTQALSDDQRRFSAGNEVEDMIFLDEFVAFANLGSARPAGRIYHLAGAHAPFHLDTGMNHTGYRDHAPGPFHDQSVAMLRLLVTMFERLREVGAYDNSLILVVGDHGNGEMPALDLRTDGLARLGAGPGVPACEDPDLLEVMRGALPLVLAKPPNATGPLRISNAPVELGDIAATVAEVMDLTGAPEGRSLFAPEVDPQRKRLHRFYRFTGWDQDFIVPMTEYVVGGFSWDPRSWSLSERNMNRTAARSVRGDMALLGARGNLEDFPHAGWSAPESDGRFIAGDTASLTFPTPEVAETAALQLTLKKVGTVPDTELQVLAGSNELAVLLLGGIAPERYRVLVPAGAWPPGSPSEIRFVPRETPLEGSLFVEIRLEPAFERPAWPGSAEVSFGNEGDGTIYLNHGWGVPEPWGVWNRGSRSELSLSIGRRPRGDVLLKAKLMGAVFEGSPAVRASLAANGETVAEFTCERQFPDEHVFRIPARLVGPDGSLDLSFEVENPRSPQQYGLNQDSRLLGVGVWSLTIEADSGDQ